MQTSLLPPSASQFEKDLENAVRIRPRLEKEINDDLGQNVSMLFAPLFWNYKECPEKYLPFLAWSLGVDIWQDDWSEEQKRQTIETWLKIRARRGTRFSIEKALEALNIEADITEWFEDSDAIERYNFDVTIFLDQQPEDITTDLFRRIERIVERLKPIRSAVGYNVGVRIKSKTFGVATARPFKTVELSAIL
ncbi:MAG: phage tail protein I [Pseudobacteriovorax sp.]|nr:phage tail protein I [Pseudobacteriovorax sp.]